MKFKINVSYLLLAICFLIITITYGTAFTFGVYLRPLHYTFGCSIAKISVCYSFCLLFYTGFSIIAGWIVDIYGVKVTTMISGTFLTIGFIVNCFTYTPWNLYLGYSLVGLGMSFIYTPLMTIITKEFSKSKGMALGLIGIGISVGPLILSPFASYIISKYNWRICYLIYAFLTSSIIILSLSLKKIIKSIHKSYIHNEKFDFYNKNTNTYLKCNKNGICFKKVILIKQFWIICIITFMIGLTVQMVIGHIVAYCEIKGMNSMNAAVVLSTIAGANIIGKVLMGMLSDKIGRKKTLTICLLIESIMIYFFIQVSNKWSIYLIAGMFGFGYGGHGPQLPAITGEYFGLRNLGTILGSTTFFYGLAGAIGIVLAGIVVDLLGSYDMAFLIAVLAMLIGGTLSCILKPPSENEVKK